jgi:hypothetical protein
LPKFQQYNHPIHQPLAAALLHYQELVAYHSSHLTRYSSSVSGEHFRFLDTSPYIGLASSYSAVTGWGAGVGSTGWLAGGARAVPEVNWKALVKDGLSLQPLACYKGACPFCICCIYSMPPGRMHDQQILRTEKGL